MIYYVVPREQEFGIRNYLNQRSPDLGGLLSILHYEELPARTSLPAGTYIFSALDQLTPGGVRVVRELQAQLRASPAVGTVLNDPDTALLRLDLLEELYRQGLNRHRAVRATGDLGGLRYPVFLREELEHTGSLTPLLKTPAEVERALGWVVVQGHRLEDLLVVEFYDTADPGGLYRKYSAFVVGPAIIARGMARGHRWMLKAEGAEFSEEMLLEERAYALGNPYEEQLRSIFSLSGIQFGRIDFAIKDGTVETWEINTNPTIGPGPVSFMPEEFVPLRQPMRDHFRRSFRAALEALDSGTSSQPVAVSYSAECLGSAVPVVRPRRAEGTFLRVASALPFLRPLFKGVARVASPLVAWASRRLR